MRIYGPNGTTLGSPASHTRRTSSTGFSLPETTAAPEEVRSARKVLRERDSIISEAQQQADEILKTAHEQAEMLLDRQGLMAEAEARAKQYMEQIENDAQERINGADEYAREVLSQLREQLTRHLHTIEKGLDALDSR